ncbi:MAG: hypothetical protein Q8L34_00380 [Candidatus Woesearchaeota archaeon]|nr:hypothetical protein [Candidatus Woesearchaeota archaeon]
MKTKLFLFGTVLALLLVAVIAQNHQAEAAPTALDYCKKSIQFSQRNSESSVLSDAFSFYQNGAGSISGYFAILSPEIEGKLIGIKDLKILGYYTFTGSGGCNLVLNNTICHNFPTPPIDTRFIVSLPSCLNQLDLQGINNLTLDCSNASGNGDLRISRIVYEGVWNSCA